MKKDKMTENIIEFLKIISRILAVLLFIGLILLLLFSLAERQKWLKQHCTKIGEQSGSTVFINTYGKNSGFGTAYVPGKTGWSCDDGVTYWE